MMVLHGMRIREGKDAPAMAGRTSLRLGGTVLAEVLLTDPAAAAAALPEIARRLGGRLVCLGAGSNILAGEGPLPLVLVRDGREGNMCRVAEEGESVSLRATASLPLPALLSFAARHDLAGLEGLWGIPGSVGGAVAMNAGSFGQSIAESLTALELVTEAGVTVRYSREDITLAYRHMDIPSLEGWWMILGAEFLLHKAMEGSVRAKGREIMERKRASQPVAAASAGCVFKNPLPEQAAGRLLEEAGFRGKRLGGMTFSAIHANFLVNEGQGRSSEALELMQKAKEAVFARSGITLEPEVKLWL